MAAGIGSRFGEGIKQLTTVGPNGEILMDYSVYDAVQAGFEKIVFIIRKDIETDFREMIGDRLEAEYAGTGVELVYVFQEQDILPEGCKAPAGRKKPWGTTHAIWCCKDVTDGPFAVINADDYYGKFAYKKMHEFLTENHEPGQYCMAGFVLKNTLSESGTVTRGICKSEDGKLTHIDETKNIIKTASGAMADGRELDVESLVSMNMWGLKEDIFPMLEESLVKYFSQEDEKILSGEALIPINIGEYIGEKKCSVRVLPTDDIWFGMTYRQDVPDVRANIAKMTAAGEYPESLV